MKLTIFILMFLLVIAFAAADVNVSKNITLVVTQTQIGLGQDGGVSYWFNSNNYTTYNTLFTWQVGCVNPVTNDTNYTLQFNNLQQTLMGNISTTYVSRNQEIVDKINANTNARCDFNNYSAMINNMLSTAILPNKTQYDALQKSFDDLNTENQLNRAGLTNKQAELDRTNKENYWLIWIIIALAVFNLMQLFFVFGGSILSHWKWKVGEKKALKSSKYEGNVVKEGENADKP